MRSYTLEKLVWDLIILSSASVIGFFSYHLVIYFEFVLQILALIYIVGIL